MERRVVFFIFPFSFKDDEIQKQARLINQLKEQLSDQEESLKSSQVDTERLQSQINTMQSESETSKTEVKEVLQALEELAVNYDQKLQEVETKTKDNDKLSEELSQKQVQYTWLELWEFFFSFHVIQNYRRNLRLNIMFVLHAFIGHKCKLNGYYDLSNRILKMILIRHL